MVSFLVTGGAGFIGSHIAEALLERGYRVDIIDNLTKKYSDDLTRHDEGGVVTFQYDTGKVVARIRADGIIECPDAVFGIGLSKQDDFEETEESKKAFKQWASEDHSGLG